MRENILKKYEDEIDRLMKLNGGELTPEQIVEAAKHKESPLHSYFSWNDNEEANLWRLHKARILFGCVITRIKVKNVTEEKFFRKYVNVVNKDKEHVYVTTITAIKTKKYAKQIIDQCIDTSKALTLKLELFRSEI